MVFESPRCVIKPKCNESKKRGVYVTKESTSVSREEKIKRPDITESEVMSGKQCSIKVMREV